MWKSGYLFRGVEREEPDEEVEFVVFLHLSTAIGDLSTVIHKVIHVVFH
jgi:hypothetical protein